MNIQNKFELNVINKEQHTVIEKKTIILIILIVLTLNYFKYFLGF